MRSVWLAGALALAAAGGLSAQSVMERSPNLHGTWTLQSGHAAFVFAHRFDVLDGGDQLYNVPTLSLALGLPLGLTAGLEYSSNSEIVVGELGSNETEYWLKRAVGLGQRAAVAGIVAYNNRAGSFDGALSARTDLGRLGLMGELRGFSDLFATGEAGAAAAVGAVARLTPYLGITGDVGKVVSVDSFDAVWSAGIAIAIPGSPHTLNLHASNGGAMTLQGASRAKAFATDQRRYGFAFTIPLGNGSQWARIFRPAPALTPAPAAAPPPVGTGPAPEPGAAPAAPAVAPPAAAAAVQVPIRMIAFQPPQVRIRAGQTVEWINQDPTAHTVTGEGWTSEILMEGGRYSRKFDQPGRYPYRCLPHPQMVGVVIVE
jgi:plastocyanin